MANSPDSHHPHNGGEKARVSAEVQVHVPELPEHWDFGGEIDPLQVPWNPLKLIPRILCLISFGHATLDTIWESSHKGTWRATTTEVKERLDQVNVMVRFSWPSKSFIGVERGSLFLFFS